MILENALRSPDQVKPFYLDPPKFEFSDKRYLVRFAQTDEEIDQVLKLRYDVFNLEMGEGLDSSVLTQRDRDEFDEVCHHLIVIDQITSEIVGTYRMQTQEIATKGFYSSAEFKIDMMKEKILRRAVEVGRACIRQDHRKKGLLFMMWKGLAKYMVYMHKRYLFGCCSIQSQDPTEAKLIMDYLEKNNYIHPKVYVEPQEAFRCYDEKFKVKGKFEIKLPKLFKSYLDYDAMVCGPPAIDKEFKTIDYFVLLDIKRI
ncbi:MAG: GNAT family N-acetyltransferase, partial [Calditrichaeota bacterium]|nr:GNAT family N-acetyltransferase [Calditrichota bacterium]